MLDNYQTMDINILLSIVNMKLRNEKQQLAVFCNRYQLDLTILQHRLESNGFVYDAQQSQFKTQGIREK